MHRKIYGLFLLSFSFLWGYAAVSTNNINSKEMEWDKLPDLPGRGTTTSLGVSAPFTAVCNNQLIVAGGCNFPDKPVTEGGKKKYYDEVFAIDLTDRETSHWKLIGKLPQPTAYGTTVTVSQGIVCIGGNNQEQSFSEVWLLTPGKEEIQVTALPALPFPSDNLSAAAIGNKVYIAGGNTEGKASNQLLCLDMSDQAKGWKRLRDFPGSARVQPVLVAQKVAEETCLYLAGGYRPLENNQPACVSETMLFYKPSSDKWIEIGKLPTLSDGLPRTLTGGYGVAYKEHTIILGGGVNYQRFLKAIDRPRQMEEACKNKNSEWLNTLQIEEIEYMFHPIEWYKFNKELVAYNTLTYEWVIWGAHEKVARAGAGAVIHNETLIIINGELKPGIRTAEVNRLSLNSCFAD